MSFPGIEYIYHIVDEINYLKKHTKDLSKKQFIQNDTLKRAFVRCLEIIGEATKKVPGQSKQEFPNIEWKLMTSMRDKLIHDYFGIDYDIVWDVVINKIPSLYQEIKKIIDKEK